MVMGPTTNSSRLSEDRFISVYSRAGKCCPNIRTAMNRVDLNQQLILNSKQFQKIQGQLDRILDCQGRDEIQNIRDTKWWAIDLDWDVDRIAHPVFESYAHGVAVSDGATGVNKRFTLTKNTSNPNPAFIHVSLNGNTAISAPLPNVLSLEVLKNILDNLENVGKGNSLVTGTGDGPFVVEFINKLGNSDEIELTVLDGDSSPNGGYYTAAMTRAGTANVYTLSEVLGEIKTFDLINGDKLNSASGFYLLHNCVINRRTITCPASGRVTRKDELLIRRVERIVDYIPPECENPIRLRASDVAIKVGDSFRNEAAEIVDNYSNNIVTDEEAFGREGGYVSQWETNKPTSSIQVTYKGDFNHDQFIKQEDAQLEDDPIYENVELYLGKPAHQEVIKRPAAAITGDPDIVFAGDAKRARFTVTYNTTTEQNTGIREIIELTNVESQVLLDPSV